MRPTTGTAAVMSILALVSTAPSRAQVQSVPGPGSGVVTVVGKVDIENVPTVVATQGGEWKVVADTRVTNTPTVVIASPPFLKQGGRYEVWWSGAEKEIVRIVQVSATGWVQVDAPGRGRWMNLTAARSVQEVP